MPALAPLPRISFREGHATHGPTKRGRRQYGRLQGVVGTAGPQGLPRRRVAVAGGGLHRHAHDALVASGLPHGLRRASVHEGQQAGQGGGRPAERRGERQAVHALSDHAGGREPSRPPEVPPAPRGRARRGPVGAHHLGRGLRRDHRKGLEDQGGARLRDPSWSCTARAATSAGRCPTSPPPAWRRPTSPRSASPASPATCPA